MPMDPYSDPYRLMNCRFFNNLNQCRRSEPRSDWHHFDGSGPGSTFRACRSGSVSISSKCKDKLLFPKKFQYAVENTEKYDTYDDDDYGKGKTV
jgi:hypothetical protein